MTAASVDEVLAGAPEVIDGFPAFAPELAKENADFPADLFPALAEVEERSFWFLGRNRILQWLFDRFVGGAEREVLEIGCGTGFVLSGFAKRFPAYSLTGAEIYTEGLRFAQQRVPTARFCQLDATGMPFEAAFDVVGCFDVLEHITEDRQALAGVHQALRAGGHVVITVPQHAWLWSDYDEAGDHKRRYARADLLEKVKSAGFEVRYVSSFVTSLLPLLLANRWAQRGSSRRQAEVSEQAMKDLAPGGAINAAGTVGLRIDEALMKLGISLPVGGSLTVVGRKRHADK